MCCMPLIPAVGTRQTSDKTNLTYIRGTQNIKGYTVRPSVKTNLKEREREREPNVG